MRERGTCSLLAFTIHPSEYYLRHTFLMADLVKYNSDAYHLESYENSNVFKVGCKIRKL